MIRDDDRSLIRYLIGEDAFEDEGTAGQYSYITNPDATIRWVYPKQLKYPYFLSFYSTSSFRAKVLSSIIKLAFFAKQSHRIKSGDLKLNISDTSRLGKILNEYTHTGFSIFTGTVGENRKAVIELHNDKQLFMFVKIALKDAAKTLIDNEAKCLKYLNTFEFSSIVIPKLLHDNERDIIGVSNIKPKSFQQNSSLANLHIQALSELYAVSNMEKKWIDLEALHESKRKLKTLLSDFEELNDLSKCKVQDFAKKILTIVSMLEKTDEAVMVAISHGDFTPWNMYSSNNVLHVFDWELSQKNMPLIFDLFHFVFQSEIMIKHTDYKGIINEIDKLMQMKSMQNLIDNYHVDFNKNYMFYIIYNATYYLCKYIKQKDLHEQVFWLVDIWEEAIDDIVKKKGIVF